ncbi:MAG: hypothetical protein WC054_13150 [Candidatus Nanopelagicales bacterium]
MSRIDDALWNLIPSDDGFGWVRKMIAAETELVELRRRHQALLDALDTDRTTIPKRVVRAILKGR